MKPFLGKKIKDKIKVIGGNWKEELQKYIDPSELPEFFGGECKDENGSGKCEEKICYGGIVPDRYHVNKNVKKDEFRNTFVESRRTLTIDILVEKKPSTIYWQYITDNHDIFFGIKKETFNGKLEVVLKTQRNDSNLIMQEGKLLCEETGKYLITFDNRYSLLKGKNLYYNITQSE